MLRLVYDWQALDDNVNEFAKVVLETHGVPDIIGMSSQPFGVSTEVFFSHLFHSSFLLNTYV
jgi:hypothetical protein